MKKELDLAQIMRDSIMKANKDLGFLKEQEEKDSSAFDEEFDVKKHMPSFQIKAKSWGISGTTDAKQLDAVLKNIIPSGEQDGLVRFKKGMENLNRALGTKFSQEGKGAFQPVEAGEKSTLNEIISSLMVKNIINNIINETSAQAAGKTFESFVARMAGGIAGFGNVETIEDLYDAAGNPISLKTIIGATEIKGSKSGLARGIVQSPNGVVNYLVCVKDRESDPFKMSAYSFKVDRNNYFNVITGKKSPSLEDIRNQEAQIFKTVSPSPKKESLQEEISSAEIEQAGGIDALLAAHYGTDNRQEIVSKLVQEIKSALEPATKLSTTQINLLNRLMTRTGSTVDFSSGSGFIDNFIKKMVVTGDGKKIAKGPFERLLTVFPQAIEKFGVKEEDVIFSIFPIYKASDTEKQIEDIINYHNTLDKKTELGKKEAEREYRQSGLMAFELKLKELIKSDYEEIKRAFGKFTNFLINLETQLRKTVPPEAKKTTDKFSKKAAEERERQYASKEEEQSVKTAIDDFFNKLTQSVSETLESLLEDKTDTQFYLSQNIVKSLVQIDEDYPTVIIESQSLFTAAQDNAETFKKWAEPIYRGMHNLTQGINQYFIEDKPNGLSKADNDGIKVIKSGIDELTTKKTGGSPEEPAKASSLQEVNKTSFNDDFLSDILKDLI